MEFIGGLIFVIAVLAVSGYGLWFLCQPKAVKKIGDRSLYVKWNKK